MRSVWNGVVQFGLVTVPVALYKAIEDSEKVSFNQLDAESQSRIRQKKVRESDGAEVTHDTIVKGWPIAKDEYVVVSDEEIAAIQGVNDRIIELISFASEDFPYDPIYQNTAYYVGPQPNSSGPAQLLMDAMSSCNAYAFGRFMMRSRQYLCTLHVTPRGFVLFTLNWPETIREPLVWEGRYDPKNLPMAEQLVQSLMSEDLELEGYRDPYADAIKELVATKAAGKTIEVVASVQPGAIDNLFETLRASIEESKNQKGLIQ